MFDVKSKQDHDNTSQAATRPVRSSACDHPLTPRQSHAIFGGSSAWRRRRAWRRCKHLRCSACRQYRLIASTGCPGPWCCAIGGFHLRNSSLAGLAVPDANRVALDASLAAESADVLGVLGDLHLLDRLTQGRTVPIHNSISFCPMQEPYFVVSICRHSTASHHPQSVRPASVYRPTSWGGGWSFELKAVGTSSL